MAKRGGGEKAFLEHEEVIDLLRQEIARAGGQETLGQNDRGAPLAAE